MKRLTGFKFPRHNHQTLMLRKILFTQSNKIMDYINMMTLYDNAEHMIPTTFHELTQFKRRKEVF
jgi:hypothetical protein